MLNENNIQAPFQYKIGENDFELLTRNGELELNTNNVQVKVFEGQRLFCADIGYAVDGALEEMEFLIDDIKVYPVLLDELKDLQTAEVKENEIYLIKNDINFKSIIFFPTIDLNKNFKYTITTYSSTFSAFMFDEIAKKLNVIDVNAPIKNYYKDTYYKINDIIKYNGYLYRVFREFTSDNTDYYLQSNCNLITPFKKLELNTEYKINNLVEYNNDFFAVQKDFIYDEVTNLNDVLKPIQEFIRWNDNIKKVYQNQIILKDDFCYLVLITSENYTFNELLQFKRIDYLNKASNTFYDDSNSSFGNNTNTIQKAIEKLNNTKQYNLTAGNNINLNANTISVNGGVSKSYSLETQYLINDLILYENSLYIANENFISSDWQTDKNKLTLLTASGSLSTASQVAYDNNKTNLEYLDNYDFPKFKIQIPNIINLVLTDSINDYTAYIEKLDEENYILNCQLNNFESVNTDNISINIKSVDESSDINQMYSILSQFFEFGNIYYNLETEEGSISDISESLKVNFLYSNNSLYIVIKKYNETTINQELYNITLNIKNRILRKLDTNIFCKSNNYLFNLELIQNYDSINIIGSYTHIEESNIISFFSPILENYFNTITYSSDNDLINTDEIISSTGKAMKYGFVKNSDNNYSLLIAHQDNSVLENGEIFNFNLKPNKNQKLEAIYKKVINVQQLGEALNEKIDNTIFNLTSDGEECKHPTEKFNGKPVYYRCFYNPTFNYSSGGYPNGTVFNNNNEWNIDTVVLSSSINNVNHVYIGEVNGVTYPNPQNGTLYTNMILDSLKKITINTKAQKKVLAIFKYTKTTDSVEL